MPYSRNTPPQHQRPRAVGATVTLVQWLVFMVTAGFLAWRILVVNLSQHFSLEPEDAAVANALAWNRSNPEALYRQGRLLANSDPAAAQELLTRAAWENPADGRVYVELAKLWQARGNPATAAALLDIANRLAPKHGGVQLEIANYWLQQQRPDRAMAALDANPALRVQIYPALLRLAADPKTRSTLAPAVSGADKWWGDLLGYAVMQGADPNLIQVLYELGGAAGRRPTAAERNLYLAWLQGKDRWQEARNIWLDSLDPMLRKATDLLYDGGFEYPFASGAGFGWQTLPVDGVAVDRAPAPGAPGDMALRVAFQGQKTPFQHFYQHLLLPPGRYELSGRVRLEGLQAAKGVQWTLRCASGTYALLGQSEPFRGDSEWRPFQIQFTVPGQQCPAQLLRLHLAGQSAQDFEASGVVWFDGLEVRGVR